MPIASETSLELGEGVELGYALVARAAENIGARALAIKGLVGETHRLRKPRASADVDVLVEPDRSEDLVDTLVRAGWHRTPTSVVPTPFGSHSVTLNHPHWPCEIDVHHRFPGFLADRTTTFDALWAEHTFIVAAGIAVPATDLYGTTLVMALHALRTPSDSRKRHELFGLVGRLPRRHFDPERLRRLASTTGCLATARPFLQAVGVDTSAADTRDPAVAEWELRQTVTQTRNLGWVSAVRRTPPWRWPGIILKVLLADEAMLRHYYPHAPAGRRGLWLARWWRLKLAVRDLPQAIRIVRRLPKRAS
jgi:hypothetical protein